MGQPVGQILELLLGRVGRTQPLEREIGSTGPERIRVREVLVPGYATKDLGRNREVGGFVCVDFCVEVELLARCQSSH